MPASPRASSSQRSQHLWFIVPDVIDPMSHRPGVQVLVGGRDDLVADVRRGPGRVEPPIDIVIRQDERHAFMDLGCQSIGGHGEEDDS